MKLMRCSCGGKALWVGDDDGDGWVICDSDIYVCHACTPIMRSRDQAGAVWNAMHSVAKGIDAAYEQGCKDGAKGAE